MSICTTTDANGFVITTPDAIESCTEMVLISQSEFLQFSQFIEGSEIVTISDIFTIPESAELGEAFLVSFTLIMTCYLVSWAFGSIINFFHPDNERY
jgi:hypothetical protein